MKIIIASTSPYRAQQLRDLGLRFTAVAPQFDEEAYKAQSPRLSPKILAKRLAYEKAMSVARALSRAPEAIVIGADQVVSMTGQILGKPGSHKKAMRMLAKMQGRSHKLITSVCVVYVTRGKITAQQHVDIVKIKMRQLTQRQISHYVRRDRPYDCAGGYRFEKGGLALVEKMALRDPSSLIGLPIIELTRMLSKIYDLEKIL